MSGAAFAPQTPPAVVVPRTPLGLLAPVTPPLAPRPPPAMPPALWAQPPTPSLVVIEHLWRMLNDAEVRAGVALDVAAASQLDTALAQEATAWLQLLDLPLSVEAARAEGRAEGRVEERRRLAAIALPAIEAERQAAKRQRLAMQRRIDGLEAEVSRLRPWGRSRSRSRSPVGQ